MITNHATALEVEEFFNKFRPSSMPSRGVSPFDADYQVHRTAQLELWDFMRQFMDLGAMTVYQFESYSELSNFWNEHHFQFGDGLLTLSGQLRAVMNDAGTLIGYLHVTDAATIFWR